MPTRQRIAMHRLVLSAVLLTACAPAYFPAAVHVPLHAGAGERRVTGSVGTQGLQVDGSVSVTDNVAVRARLQATSLTPGTGFKGGGVGAGWFTATPEGLRVAASLDLGADSAVSTSTVTGGRSGSNFRSSGFLLQGGLQFDVGWQFEAAAVGAALRLNALNFHHDDESDARGTIASWLYAEPVLFVRLGRHGYWVDLQGGLALPVVGDGEIGVPLPVILSLGVGLEL